MFDDTVSFISAQANAVVIKFYSIKRCSLQFLRGSVEQLRPSESCVEVVKDSSTEHSGFSTKVCVFCFTDIDVWFQMTQSCNLGSFMLLCRLQL